MPVLGYPASVKTTIDVDKELAARAAEILGTKSLRETVDAALEEVIAAFHRNRLADAILDGTLSVPTPEELARLRAPKVPVGLLDEPPGDAAA